MKLALLILLLLYSGSGKGESALDKYLVRLEKGCESTTCGHLLKGFNENCVNYCISRICFEQVYGSEMLEEGEQDFKRQNLFKNCVKGLLRPCQSDKRSFEQCREKL